MPYTVGVTINDLEVAGWDVKFQVGLTLDPTTTTAIGPGVGSIGVDREKLYLADDTLATRGLRSRYLITFCSAPILLHACSMSAPCLLHACPISAQLMQLWPKCGLVVVCLFLTRGFASPSLAGPRLLAGEIVAVSIQTRTVEGWSMRTGGATVTMQFQVKHLQSGALILT